MIRFRVKVRVTFRVRVRVRVSASVRVIVRVRLGYMRTKGRSTKQENTQKIARASHFL